MAKSEQITYHVTTSQTWIQNRSQIFISGTGRDFSEVRKSSKSGFFSLSKRALLVPETKIWDLFWNSVCDVVTWKEIRSLSAIGKWCSRFFSFYIGLFLRYVNLTFCQFRKRKMVQSWFRKLFWNQNCDVVGNLVVEIEFFNFCLFVCLLVCLYLTFCQFRKRKMVQSWFQKLFWNQGCDAVLNLAVEFSIWNFYIFHSTLLPNGPRLSLEVFKIVLKAKGDQIQNCMLCDWSILDPLSPEDLAPLWLFGYLHYLHYLIG